MPTRAERLADHFIQSAGIAAVYVDAGGSIGIADCVGAEFPKGRALLCCAPGNERKIAAAAISRHRAGMPPADALAAVRSAAAELGMALTPHETVISRAFAAVAAVSEKIAVMQRSGAMKDLNRDFKAARKNNPQLRYHDYLHDRKAAMLAALARPAGLSAGKKQEGRPMSERTENEKTAANFDGQLTAILKSAKKQTVQLWPGVVGQLEMAQHHVRAMMHPDDAAKAR